MGFTPQQVKGMIVWEFACCCAAMSKDHSGDVPSDAEMRDMGIVGFENAE